MKKLPRKVIIKDNEQPVTFRVLGGNNIHPKGGNRYYGRAEGFNFANGKLHLKFNSRKNKT